VLHHDEDITDCSARDRRVGFVFQHYALFRHMTIADNIGYALRVRGVSKAERRARVDELLKLIRLEGYGGRYPAQLSGGQRQRGARARWRRGRKCCCSTSRSALSTQRSGRSCGSGSGGCTRRFT
jgi:sulfate transport system ATP-binding protein